MHAKQSPNLSANWYEINLCQYSFINLLINLFIGILIIVLSVKYEMLCHSFFKIALQEDICIFKKTVRFKCLAE